MKTPAEVIAQARTLAGVPFVHQGRSARGVDCAGLVVLTAQALGLSSVDVAGYARSPDGKSLQRAIVDAGCVPCDIQPAALLLMRWDKRDPQHLGLVTDYPGALGLIHAYSINGRVVEHRLDATWLRRVVSAWALPGVRYALEYGVSSGA